MNSASITGEGTGRWSVVLDESQQRVVAEARAQSFAVVGAPGSGLTTTLVELVADAVDQGTDPAQILAIGANRRSAARLRDQLQQRLQRATTGSLLGRTLPSVAMEIISASRARAAESSPRLLTGAQQDVILHDLLEGDVIDARERGVWRWGTGLDPETLMLRGFRDEARDLLAAMVERGVTPAQLEQLGDLSDQNEQWLARNRFRQHWRGFADFAERYFDVLESGYSGVFDTPMACREAVRVLGTDTASLGAFAELKVIVVDDAQELTASARSLLLALAERGARLITFGNPDIASGTFHGGVAKFAGGWQHPATRTNVPVRTLEYVYRHGQTIRNVVQQTCGAIGTAGVDIKHRRSASLAERAGNAYLSTAASFAEAENDIAQFLRWQHLLHGVPWNEMAVIVRSSASLASLAQRLERGKVRTQISGSVTFADDAVVRAILTMALAVERGDITAEGIAEVLQSPLYGVDPLQLRALRRLVYFTARSSPHADPNPRGGMELLAESVSAAFIDAQQQITAPAELLGTHGNALVREQTRQAVFALVDALQRMRRRLVANEPIDVILYEAWHDDERAARWQQLALSQEPGAAEMNRRLDAVVALFERAKRLVEQEPGTPLSSFVAKWQSASVHEDSLIARGRTDAVTLTTPTGAIGRQWRVVVVAGVTEGAWPNLRLRDSLLGAGRLAEALENSEALSLIDRRKAVQFDEYRMLTAAISRASDRVLISTVNSEDAQPASILSALTLEPLPEALRDATRILNDLNPSAGSSDAESLSEDGSERKFTARDVLTVDGLAATLRRSLLQSQLHPQIAPGSFDTAEVRALGALAAAGVRAADPNHWYGIQGASTTAPLVPSIDGELTLSVSPSRIAALRECPVNAFLSQVVSSPAGEPQWLGTMIHDLAEHEQEYASHEAMKNEALRRVDAYPFASEWMRQVLRAQALQAVDGLWSYLKQAQPAIGYETKFVSEAHLQALSSRAETVDVTVQLRGQIDRLEIVDGSARIIDFKTTATNTERADESPQLQAYRIACVRGDIDALPNGEPFGSAALVFPRIPRSRPVPASWSERVLTPADDDELLEQEAEFNALALAAVGVNVVQAERSGDVSRTVVDAPPELLRAVEAHCASASHGGIQHDCALHVAEEVCA